MRYSGTKIAGLGVTAKPIMLKDVKGSEKVLSVDKTEKVEKIVKVV